MTSMCLGVVSSRIARHLLVTGTVVHTTIIEKRKVQNGSKYQNYGKK